MLSVFFLSFIVCAIYGFVEMGMYSQPILLLSSGVVFGLLFKRLTGADDVVLKMTWFVFALRLLEKGCYVVLIKSLLGGVVLMGLGWATLEYK